MMKHALVILALCLLEGMSAGQSVVAAEAMELYEQNRKLNSLLEEKLKAVTVVLEQNRDLAREKTNLQKCLTQQESIVAHIQEPEKNQIVVPSGIENPPSAVILEEPFDGRRPRDDLADLEDGRKALKVAVEVDSPKPDRMVCLWLNAEQVRAKKLRCTVQAKGVDIRVVNPKIGYLGGKFLLMANVSGKACWPDAAVGGGSFGWRELVFTYDAPYNLRSAGVLLGLQGATGIIYFRNLKIEALEE